MVPKLLSKTVIFNLGVVARNKIAICVCKLYSVLVKKLSFKFFKCILAVVNG